MTQEDLERFNIAWLKAWTDKDVPGIAAMYAEDCSYVDGANAGGLTGRAALTAYIGNLFPHLPDWHYAPDALWPVEGGFCARWFLDMGGKRFRGFDFVLLKDGLIAHNEVYTMPL
ncbi:nuclear transport factor 2 family protein [Novosphingobium sp. JCM 18896]|uniref:nuclear transport factor 2 family protein n=1 Tax=Novosphingobium sp. JCM 18896 TaxID=2989731 RepID=UPI002223D432|nr:nuclear transport factor 2 family protein [Novosphingobium sp. JCM 18896]MCW1428328.1 nuclear transport factor 2 family protein [Novosphingobium sp. JCM 18896]